MVAICFDLIWPFHQHPEIDPKFSSLGLVYAAVLGLTDPAYNTNANLQFIPNMDGFPNGRRLEDDVTRIEFRQWAESYWLRSDYGMMITILVLPEHHL